MFKRVVAGCLALAIALGAAPFAAVADDAAQSRTLQARASSLLGSLLDGNAKPDLLPPDEAYRIAIRFVDARTLAATLTPAPDYYLYRDRTQFRIEDPPGMTIEGVTLPDGEPKRDPTFGDVPVYHHPVEAMIHLSAPATGPLRVHARYQGCNEPLGVCYPPIEKTLTVAPASLSAQSTAPQTAIVDRSESARLHDLFAGGLLPLLATFFGLGVLLAFTPCMLPMLPILSGIVVGQGRHVSRGNSFLLSAAYVLGMATTYAAVGVAAGLAGSLLSAYLQSPAVLFAFAAIFVALALAMFDVYRFQLPSRVQSAVARAAQHIPGGRVATVFVMGGVSALIVGPCVAAPLAGALLYIGQTRDGLLGGAALFTLAIGMGLPLILVGTTAAGLLRRAGALSLYVQRAFGVVMLALAIYIVSPVISMWMQQLLWATLLIVSSMFVHALDPLPVDAAGHRRLFKGVGVLGLVVGVATLAGALGGSPDLLHPLAGLRMINAPAAESAAFERVHNSTELDARLRAASGREVMLDFWAEWCISCKEMDRFTFSDPRVRARLQTMLLLRADVTGNTADDQALLRRFALFGPPGTVFFDSQGREQPERVIGFEQPDAFLASMERALPRSISTSQRSSP